MTLREIIFNQGNEKQIVVIVVWFGNSSIYAGSE